jgi:phage-related protein
MGGDLKGATMQVGKALQDPTQGMLALRKTGVSFSESQQQIIKDMQATGDLAGAQQMILAELNKEFGGSAQADAATYSGQMTILKHEFANVKEEIGGMVMALVIKLKPVMEKGIELFRDTVTWMQENQTLLEAVAVSVGVLGAAWLVYQTPLLLTTVITTAMTAAQWALNIALTANPIGVVVVALAALAGGIYYAWQKSEQFRGGVMGVWEVLKGLFNFVVAAGSGIGTYLEGIFTLDTEKIKSGAMEVAKAWKDMDLEADYNRGYSLGVKPVTEDKKTTTKAPGKGMLPSAEPMSATKGKVPSAANVTGQKVYTINISIDSLVKDFKVQTTNITEGAGKVKELVTQALLSAVNDSQIIAER